MKAGSRKNTAITACFTVIAVLLAAIIFSLAQGDRPSDVNDPDSSINNPHYLLNASMSYIEENHPETSTYTNNTTWKLAEQVTEGENHETWISENGWIASIKPKEAEKKATVRLIHEEGISWEGNIDKHKVEEKGYNYTMTEKEKDIKDVVMRYLVERHPEVSEHVGDLDNMTWKRTGSKLLQGYSEFNYTSDGWKLTIGYAITAPQHKTHEILLENTEEGIKWLGVIEEDTITEKSYQKNK